MANVERLITQLNERARKGIEDDEKRRKRRNAATSELRDGTSSMGQREVTSAMGYEPSMVSR